MVVNALSSETIALTEKRMDMVLGNPSFLEEGRSFSCCVATLYRRVASYKDSDDLKRDLRLLLAPVTLGVTTISWVAGMLEPKMKLPTSPSSTAVQDRVLQAESQPADAEEIQGSDQVNEKLDCFRSMGCVNLHL